MQYLYLCGSTFLVSFTAPNKQLPSIKSVIKSFHHVFNSYKIYKLTTSYEKIHCLVLNRFL